MPHSSKSSRDSNANSKNSRELPGFIRCEHRVGLLPFFNRNISPPSRRIINSGSCVEFNPNKDEALRIERLPHSSVVVENVEETVYQGVIWKPPRKNKSSSSAKALNSKARGRDQTMGKILLCPEAQPVDEDPAAAANTILAHSQHPAALSPAFRSRDFDTTKLHPAVLFGSNEVPFERADVSNGSSIRRGDTVSFRVARHVNFPDSRRAVNITPLAKLAYVMDLSAEGDSKFELGLRTLPIPAAPGLPAIVEETYNLASKDPQFGPGDLVSFTHGDKYSVTNVVLLEKAPEDDDFSDEEEQQVMMPVRRLQPRTPNIFNNSFAALNMSDEEPDSE